ncbi:MAG: flavin reductase family protein [Pseudomonadota bacterium]
MSTPDPRALRNAFGRFMTGVTVVTTRANDGTPLGFTANSFTSVSLDPPMLLVCPGKFLTSYDAFATCTEFAISILAEAQEEVSNTFAGFKGDRFARVPHHPDCHGVPVIDGAVAQFSCRTSQMLDAGDHGILIGEVVEFTTQDGPGLGYFGGHYFRLGLERTARDSSSRSKTAGAIVQFADTVLLEKTPSGYQPPQVTVPTGAGLSQILGQNLAERGIDADLGPVFSVFDDTIAETQYAYLLASAHVPDTGAEFPHPTSLEAIPISALPDLKYTTTAIAQMMSRFAQEALTRDFTLYLGDAEAGDTHVFTERD